MNLFVSYRRSDLKDFAGRLAARLNAAAGLSRVFIDIESIEGGAAFPEVLANAVGASNVCLVLIGPDWLVKNDAGVPRLFDEDDFVRQEVRSALTAPGRTIPVLVHGAVMPQDRDLPEDIRPLTILNGVEVRHATFERDVDHLLDVILQRKPPSSFQRYLRRHPVQAGLLRASFGLLTALALLLAGAIVLNAVTGLAVSDLFGGRYEPVIVILALVLGLGALLPAALGGRRA